MDGNKRTAVAVTDAFLKSVDLKLKPGSTSLAEKLEEIAERLAKDSDPQNREQLETELENLLNALTIPNRHNKWQPDK